MKLRVLELFCFVILVANASSAIAHCTVARSASSIRGDYQGECDEKSELANGEGEARGTDTYIGHFVQGKPDGKGVYTWQDGSRLDGSFKDGKAQGAGVYISAKGVRYEGQFVNGKLEAMKASDCPAVPAPVLSC